MYEPPEEQVIAGRIASGAVQLGKDLCRGAIDGIRLDSMLETYIRDHGGVPALKGYQPRFSQVPYEHTICLSVDRQVVHGVPIQLVGPEALITIDLVVSCDGWHADTARTFTWGSDPLKQRFATESSAIFQGALKAIGPNQPTALYGTTVEMSAEYMGLGVIREYCGHGIGTEIHTEPQIVNYNKGQVDTFEVGKSYAVEPVLAYNPSYQLEHHEDGWTISTDCLASHNEDTVFIAKDRVINLTGENDE